MTQQPASGFNSQTFWSASSKGCGNISITSSSLTLTSSLTTSLTTKAWSIDCSKECFFLLKILPFFAKKIYSWNNSLAGSMARRNYYIHSYPIKRFWKIKHDNIQLVHISQCIIYVSVCWLVSLCHNFLPNFLKWREGTLPCSYRSTCYYLSLYLSTRYYTGASHPADSGWSPEPAIRHRRPEQ